MEIEKIVNILKQGGMVIIPTDTIYGIIGSALKPKTIKRLYEYRRARLDQKPFIILINQISDLDKFSIDLTSKQKKVLEEIWPGKVSVTLPCSNKKLNYLHCGLETLAFRLPTDKRLREIIKAVGPLVAPSANPANLPPAKTIKEAEAYFGDKINLYIDGGMIIGEPSTLISLNNDGTIKILRQGALKLDSRYTSQA